MLGLLALLAAQVRPLPQWAGAAGPCLWRRSLADPRAGRGPQGLPLSRRRDAAGFKMHVTTLGSPHRNAAGQIDNAVMVLHGTGGTGKQFLSPQFADELYGPGQPLDIRSYWIILPDNIGHGGSSKPSDGMRMHFPKYDYDDMVEAQHRMLTEGLGITPHAPDHGHVDGLHAQLRVGRDAIPTLQRADAARVRADRDCRPQPHVAPARDQRDRSRPGLARRQLLERADDRDCAAAENLLFVAGSAPLLYQAQYPTRAGRRAPMPRSASPKAIKTLDANDLIYQLDSSRNYNPWPKLERIKVPLTWINSADDFINPRNLPLPRRGTEAHADRALPTDRGNARDARPRHPHLGEVLEIRPQRRCWRAPVG